MRRVTQWFKDFYGAHPLHLITLLACFALAGTAARQTHAFNPAWARVVAWFVGAVIAHDLVVFPLSAIADRSLISALRSLRPRRSTSRPPVPAVNYIRIPLLGTALTFALFFPGIIRQGATTYRAATGQTQAPYLDRWLLLVAAMFTLSAVCYAVRLALTRTQRN